MIENLEKLTVAALTEHIIAREFSSLPKNEALIEISKIVARFRMKKAGWDDDMIDQAEKAYDPTEALKRANERLAGAEKVFIGENAKELSDSDFENYFKTVSERAHEMGYEGSLLLFLKTEEGGRVIVHSGANGHAADLVTALEGCLESVKGDLSKRVIPSWRR